MLESARVAGLDDVKDLKVLLALMPEEPNTEMQIAWIRTIRPHIVAQSHADIDGKYELTAPGGAHCLYAELENEYSRIVWCVPVDVVDTQPLSIDLRNANADVIWNKD